MSQMIECPQCGRGFAVPPDPCPVCGAQTSSPRDGAREPAETVVQYRLNRLASAGGVAIAGLMAGAVSSLLGRPGLGGILLLVGLAWATVLLLWTPQRSLTPGSD